jgi:hypothetical protein
MASNDSAKREMLFISYENPEDNEFTQWLALQLAKGTILSCSDLH